MDGFDEDKSEDEGNKGAVVLGRLLAAEHHALEALELAHKLLNAGAGPIERFREERWSAPGRCLDRDHRTDAALAGGGAVGLAVVSFVAHPSAGRDVGPEVKQDLELRAVACLTFREVESERPSIEINLEVDLGREAPARAAQRLSVLPPLAPAAETCARTTVESNIWTWAVWLIAASASKKASNTPAWLSRQKRFQIEFQFPNACGRARQVML